MKADRQREEAVSRATPLLGTRKSMEEIAAGNCSAVVVLLTEQLAGVSVGSRDGVCSPPG